MKSITLFIVTLLLLVSCSGDSNLQDNRSTPPVSLSCSTQFTYFTQTVYPNALDSCTACHNASNSMNITQDDMSANFIAFKNSALKTGGNGQSLVVTKPQGLDGHGGNNLNLSADDLNLLTNMASSIQNCNTIISAGVLKGTPYQQVRKITMALNGRLPTGQEETSAVTSSAQTLETALGGVIDNLMTEEAFYDRLKEVFNDLLLTDHYLPNATSNQGRALGAMDLRNYTDTRNLFNNTEFNQTLYPNDNAQIRRRANYGFARAGVELIAHVVRNNRPFTEILTADYVMVNPYTAAILLLEPTPGFSFDYRNKATLPNPNNYDKDNFQPVTIRDVTVGVYQNQVRVSEETINAYGPGAGILTDPVFLVRYPSTRTNVNRHRARIAYKYFLNTEAESFADRTALDLDNVTGTFPTLEDPQCKACHDKIDPFAGLFKNRGNNGRYQVNNNWLNMRNPPQMLDPGLEFLNETMPASFNTNSLYWLGTKLIEDDRFARSMVRHVYLSYTGRSLDDDPILEDNLKTNFVSSNFNLKSLIKEIVLSDSFLARAIDPNAPNVNPADFANVGTARMLTPEQLHRKLLAITGYNFRTQSGERLLFNRDLDTNTDGGEIFPLLYGGIDNIDVVTRTREPSAMMGAIQDRIALQTACRTTAVDFETANPAARRYFQFVEPTDLPGTADANIRANIVHLHKLFLAEELATDDPKIDSSVTLFNDVYNLVSGTTLDRECRGTTITTDANRTIQAWMAVISAMMMDYKFLYN